MVIKMLVMAHFCISADGSKILVTVWAKYISASERSYWAISENGMVNLIWSRNIKKTTESAKKALISTKHKT